MPTTIIVQAYHYMKKPIKKVPLMQKRIVYKRCYGYSLNSLNRQHLFDEWYNVYKSYTAFFKNKNYRRGK